MERFKSGGTSITAHKENDPPFGKDENESITIKETSELNIAQQVGGGCSNLPFYWPAIRSRCRFSLMIGRTVFNC